MPYGTAAWLSVLLISPRVVCDDAGMTQGVTRLAPSPTGALHVGNARTFVVNYLLARQRGWRVLMRVEDLDGPRVKAGSAEAMLQELRWLGLEWEEPVVYQSQRGGAYRAALERLAADGWAYPCVCSRKDAQIAASAPNLGDAQAAYGGVCRGRFATAAQAAATGRPVAWRLRVDEQPITVEDAFAGPSTFVLPQMCGDFVIFKSDGLAAYQLAVVLDDAAAGVDAIVRGDDLLESAARQMHLRRRLGIDAPVRYWHLPLVIGPDGRRLAKRHGDTRLSYYRARGATAERVLGLIGFTCGLWPARRAATMDELLAAFDLSKLARTPYVFTADDDAFLGG